MKDLPTASSTMPITLVIQTGKDPLDASSELHSHLLTPLQVRKFEQMIVEDLTEIANLRVANGDYAAYAQTVSCLQGRIQILELLLDQSQAAQEVLNQGNQGN